MNYRRQYVLPVPFTLKQQRIPDGRIVLFEDMSPDQRPMLVVACLCLALGGFCALALLTGLIKTTDAVFWKGTVAATLGLLFGILSILCCILQKSSIHQIQCDGNIIEIVDASRQTDTIVRSGALQEWRLVSHPIVVKQEVAGTWKGHAIALEHGDKYWIVLACLESEARSNDWLSRSPRWLREMKLEMGEPWRRKGTIRGYLKFGKRP